MRIRVIEPYVFSGDELIVGEEYEAIPVDNGTEKQNRAFHALLQEYWSSGTHSYNARNFEHFRELVKLYLGAGVEKYYSLVDEQGEIVTELKIRYRVKSWTRYTKKERKESIDRLISEMIQAGINSRKFNEILQGMNNGQ